MNLAPSNDSILQRVDSSHCLCACRGNCSRITLRKTIGRSDKAPAAILNNASGFSDPGVGFSCRCHLIAEPKYIARQILADIESRIAMNQAANEAEGKADFLPHKMIIVHHGCPK